MENKKNETIMYCSLNDGHINKEINNFAQEAFEDMIEEFHEKYGTVELQGTNDFQNIICKLPAIHVAPSAILKFDKVIADFDTQHRLTDFWEEHQMESEKPSIPVSTSKELFFVVAALMQLKATWKKEHKAENYNYDISARDAYSHEKLGIKGYHLRDVTLSLNDDVAVSAHVDLGNGINIRLSDVTAFGGKDLKIFSEHHLYELIANSNLLYHHTGSLLAPCIEEKVVIKDHLKDINWKSNDNLYQVIVQSSEALTKLKLNEKGVEARAETVTRTRMLMTSALRDTPKYYQLIIKHGLVVDIRYRNTSIFVAYVPQERFIQQ